MSVLGTRVEKEIKELLALYPHKEATLLPVLHAVQEANGYISAEAKQAVAEQVGVSVSRVYELVSFYTMFFDQPVGKNVLTVCCNMTCGLRGGESLCHYLSAKLGIRPGETTQDGKFTLIRTNECLSDCDHPPMMQINERYYSSLDRQKVDEILKGLK